MIIYCIINKRIGKVILRFESDFYITNNQLRVDFVDTRKKNYNVLEVLKSVWETINIVFIHHTSPWWRFTEKSIFTQFLSSDVSLISYIDGYSSHQMHDIIMQFIYHDSKLKLMKMLRRNILMVEVTP
jgi:hypothetical protein